MPTSVLPYPRDFPKLLEDYCEQMDGAIRANRHHDTRRHLSLNFLREAFGVANIAAAVVTKKEFDRIGELPIRAYVIDSKTYYHYPKIEEEAHYLVGILNTPFVNEAIKPLQPQGLMGERDIHRRPFEACDIPLFDSGNKLHQQIARVSAEARAELLPIVPKMQLPVAGARAAARELVAGKLNRLNELTAKLLNGQPTRFPEHKSQAMKLLELFP